VCAYGRDVWTMTRFFLMIPVAVAGKWVAAGAKRIHFGSIWMRFCRKPVNANIIKAISRSFP